MRQENTYHQAITAAPAFATLESLGESLGESRTAFQKRGRAAVSNVSSRFDEQRREMFDDGWQSLEEDRQNRQVETRVTSEVPRTAITRNTSPDLAFDRSINAYRGCEHGCIYCFARPTHAYMGLSAGQDFETQLFAKQGLPELLRKELSKPSYKPKPIALGTNTDPYQPIERERKITRQILEILLECRHPVTIVTKSALILRDIDILREMATLGLVKVAISLTSLDAKLARNMEPRAASPQRRLDAIRLLSDEGIPTLAMIAPIIPGLTDTEIETLLKAAAHAGAREASYIALRLPMEVRDLFIEWLDTHYPDRKDKVLSRISAIRDGGLNDANFGSRMRGTGVEADLMKARFSRAARRNGLATPNSITLRTDLFEKPLTPEQKATKRQLALF